MMSRELPSSNLPDPGKVEFVVDGHAAFGNPTDPISAAAGQAMISACKHASTHCISSHSQEHKNMRKLITNLSRRRFLGSATLLGIASTLLPGKAAGAASPTARKRTATKDSIGKRALPSNRKDGPQIVWTSATCPGGNMPCLNADGHPTFENPHGWTIEQMDDIYGKFLRPRSMAFNIKWMGLASYMKEGPYATVRTRLESQTHD